MLNRQWYSNLQKRVIALILAIVCSPTLGIVARASETVRDEMEVSIGAFAHDAHESTKPKFEDVKDEAIIRSVGNGETLQKIINESARYINYIDHEALIAEYYELDNAARMFQALSSTQFKDSQALSDYVQGIIARDSSDQDGKKFAMRLFNRVKLFLDYQPDKAATELNIYEEAKNEYDFLLQIYGEVTDNDLVQSGFGKSGNYAVVAASNGIETKETPNGKYVSGGYFINGSPVRIIGYEQDEFGKWWVYIDMPGENVYSESGKGCVSLFALRPMSSIEEKEFRETIEAALTERGSIATAAVKETSKLNIRPGMSLSGSIAQVASGAALRVLEKGAEWSKVQTMDNVIGYVPTQYLSPVSEAEEETLLGGFGVPPAMIIPFTTKPTIDSAAKPPVHSTKPELPSLAVSLSSNTEKYDELTWLLTAGFAGYEANGVLSQASTLASAMGGYNNSQLYLQYVKTLQFIKAGAIDAAMQSIDQLNNAGFFRLSSQGGISIPTANDLYAYALAHKPAVTESEVNYQIALLDGLDILDSKDLMMELSQRVQPFSYKYAALSIRPRDTINKPIRYPELTADELDLLRQLYSLMSANRTHEAAMLLSDERFDCIYNEAFGGNAFLFDGEHLSPLNGGHGLVLRRSNAAFFGTFVNGKPSDKGLAVGVLPSGAHVFAMTAYQQGYPVGSTEMHYMYGNDYRTVTVNFNGMSDKASGKAIQTFNEANFWPQLSFSYEVADGIVQRGNFKVRSVREDSISRWRVERDNASGSLHWFLADNGFPLVSWVSWFDGVNTRGYEGNLPGSIKYKQPDPPTPTATTSPTVTATPTPEPTRSGCVYGCPCEHLCGASMASAG